MVIFGKHHVGLFFWWFVDIVIRALVDKQYISDVLPNVYFHSIIYDQYYLLVYVCSDIAFRTIFSLQYVLRVQGYQRCTAAVSLLYSHLSLVMTSSYL